MPGVTGCSIGHSLNTIGKCKHYNAGPSTKKPADSVERVAQLIPWAGISLGQRDISDLAASRTLSVVGLIGVQNSGKTTLLTLLYCLLRRGENVGEYQFAGSYTLPAWETLAYYMTWKPGNDISFPPHTPGSFGRIPGLLHLGLKDANGRLFDILITDAKGEWFKDWATNLDGATSQTPNWIHEHSSSFILVADCEELAGPDRGTARDDLKDLYNRLTNSLNNRPVAIAWTKSDIVVRPAMKDNLKEHFEKDGLALNNFNISAYKNNEEGKLPDYWQIQALDLFAYLIKSSTTRIAAQPNIPSQKAKDLFLSIRR
ncbi:TRAFAC clade GTPase domain-containing protein [Mucilaginibacter koreensis]